MTCGKATEECLCDLTYDDETGVWQCVGKCGTKSCKSGGGHNHNSSKTTEIVVSMLTIACVLIVVGAIFYRYRRNQNQSEFLTQGNENTYEQVS